MGRACLGLRCTLCTLLVVERTLSIVLRVHTVLAGSQETVASAANINQKQNQYLLYPENITQPRPKASLHSHNNNIIINVLVLSVSIVPKTFSGGASLRYVTCNQHSGKNEC